MSRFSAIASALLLVPMLPGQEAPVAQLHEQQVAFAAEADAMEAAVSALATLPDAPFDPTAPMPDAPQGQSAAAADGGLLIDNAHSALAYIGNVRLSDPRLRLRAARRLYVVLPAQEKRDEKQEEPVEKHEAAAPAGDAPERPKRPVAEKAAEAEEAAVPADVVAEDVAVDIPGSRALLVGRDASPSLSVRRAQDSLVMQKSSSGAPASIFADEAGYVLMQGADIEIIGHTEDGEEWVLTAKQGPLVYCAQERCLIICGPAFISSPRGSLSSRDEMLVEFAEPKDEAAAKPGTPFAAFAAMQFREITRVEAKGDVVFTMPATDERPAAMVASSRVSYHLPEGRAETSAPCMLTYGAFSMKSPGGITLEGNGDARVAPPPAGEVIAGTYARPLPGTQPARTAVGSWHTAGGIAYLAEKNCISMPGGIHASDEAGMFSCTGLFEAYLIAADTPLQRKPGMPNLAVAHQQGVDAVHAEGDVRMHSAACGSYPACEMNADVADVHVPTAATRLQAMPGRTAYVSYGDYSLTAQAAEDAFASVDLFANGDILAQGQSIHAALPGKDGPVRADCRRMLSLQREAALLSLGEDGHVDSPDGIMTANGPLTAELAPGSRPMRAPAGYPQLSYNFSGIRRAVTPDGGTLRTAQVSMQCEGAIEVELLPDAPADNPRKSIRTASARSRVSVAGKDATGRLVRASGDRLDFDPATQNFYLRGSQVMLADKYNTHVASGRGACITIDPHNNVRITGERHATYANRLQEQIDSNKKH